MKSKTWDMPVNHGVHYDLLSQGYKFVESRYENEFRVSKYRNEHGDVKRVEESGKILDGEGNAR